MVEIPKKIEIARKKTKGRKKKTEKVSPNNASL